MIAPDAGEPVFQQRAAGDVVGDERVAVAVSADPGAELEEGRNRERLGGIVLLQGPLDLLQQVGDGLEQRFVEEMESPVHLLGNGRLGQPQLAGEPQQLDVVAKPVHQRLALARCPARRLQLDQPAVDPPVLLQHGDALGLGGMGRDDRADPEHLQQLVDLGRRDPRSRRRRDHLREGATHLIVAPVGFDLAPPPHRGVLFRDAQQLEPDPLHLQRPGEHLGTEVADFALTPKDRLDLRLPVAYQLQQQSGEQLHDFRGVRRRARRSRIRGLRQGGRGKRLQRGLGHTTLSRSGAPWKKRRRFSSARMPIATRVSRVALPR